MSQNNKLASRRSFIGMLLAAGVSSSLISDAEAIKKEPKSQDDVETVRMERIGRYATGDALGGAEIVSFQAGSNRLFVVNSSAGQIEVLDLSNPSSPKRESVLDVTGTVTSMSDTMWSAGGTNSVDVRNQTVAAAVEADPATDDGAVAFYDASSLTFVDAVRVGPLPDKVTISPDGNYVVVANEGEPGSKENPTGSVSVIDISSGVYNASTSAATFDKFEKRKKQLRSEGVHIVTKGSGSASVLNAIEPEFVTIGPDSKRAYVSLQENNAIATVNLKKGSVVRIDGLGFKDFSLPGNELDTSDADGISLQRWPLKGMYQPDAIDAYSIGGETFIVTANEGDAKDFEVSLLKNLKLEPEEFNLSENPYVDTVKELKKPENLGNMEVNEAAMKEFADDDGDGKYSDIYAIGGRSFSVWKPTENGLRLVYDSANDIERIFARQYPEGHLNTVESGPETETIELGQIGERVFAFVGQEVGSGIGIYDVTTPANPEYIQMVVNRNYEVTEDEIATAAKKNPKEDSPSRAGDFAPEGLHFVSAEESPVSNPLLCAGFEISGTVSVFEITPER